MSNNPSHNSLLKKIQLALSALRVVTFRNNTAMGWVGRILRRTENEITLIGYRALHAGLVKGGSDLIGWRETVVTPEMVGKKVAVFCAIEVKSGGGRLATDQRNFLHQVRRAGGVAIEGRDEATVAAQITDWMPQPNGAPQQANTE